MTDVIILIPDDYLGGGLQRSALNIRESLVPRGHRVRILCIKTLAEGYAKRLEFIQPIVGDEGGKVRFWVSFMMSLRRELHNNRNSAWLALGLVPSILLAFCSLGLRVKGLIGSERIYPPMENHSPLVRWARKLLFKRLDYVVFQAEASRGWFRDELGLPGSALELIPNVVKSPMTKASRLGDSRAVACAGRLTKQKGFDYGLKVFAKVLQEVPEARFIIVGDGPEESSLRILAEQLGLTEKVDFRPRMDDLSELWPEIDVLLLPSRYEGFPNVLAEAMAHGVASVAFDCLTGPSDLIRSGENGYLVEMGDVAGAAGFTIDLLKDPKLASSLGERAKNVAQEYSLDSVGEMWSSLIQRTEV